METKNENNEDKFMPQMPLPLTPDEIAMTKKLINRGTEVYYCLDCLALAFDVERADLERKILEFKENGCTLFR